MSKKTKDLIEIAEGFDPYSVVDTAIGGLENATAVNRKNYAYLDYADLDKDGNPAIKGEYVTLASGIYHALGLYNVYGYYYNPNITGNDFYTVYAGKVDNRGKWTGTDQTVRQADELTFARKAATTEVYATGANVTFIDTTAGVIYAGANNVYTVTYSYDYAGNLNIDETDIRVTTGKDAVIEKGQEVAWSNTINLIDTTASVIYAGGNGDDILKSDVYVNFSNSNAAAIYAGGTLGAYTIGDLIVNVTNSGNAGTGGLDNFFYGTVYGAASDFASANSWGYTYVNVNDYNGIYYGDFNWVEKVTVSGNSNVEFYGYFNEVNTLSVAGNAHATIYGGVIYDYELFLNEETVGGSNPMLTVSNFYMTPANITVVVGDGYAAYNDINLIEYIGYNAIYGLNLGTPAVAVKNADGGLIADYKYAVKVDDVTKNLVFSYTDAAYVMDAAEKVKTFGRADDDVLLAEGYQTTGAVIDLGAGSNKIDLGSGLGLFELTVKNASSNTIDADRFNGSISIADYKGVSDNTVIVGNVPVFSVDFNNTNNATLIVDGAFTGDVILSSTQTAEIVLAEGASIDLDKVQAGKTDVTITVEDYIDAQATGINLVDYLRTAVARNNSSITAPFNPDVEEDFVDYDFNIGYNATLKNGNNNIVSTYYKNIIAKNGELWSVLESMGSTVAVDGVAFALDNYGAFTGKINVANGGTVTINNYGRFVGTVDAKYVDANDTVTTFGDLAGTFLLGGGTDTFTINGDSTITADITKHEGSTLNMFINNGTVDYNGAIKFTATDFAEVNRTEVADKNVIINLSVSNATLNLKDNVTYNFDKLTFDNAEINGNFTFKELDVTGDAILYTDITSPEGEINLKDGKTFTAKNIVIGSVNDDAAAPLTGTINAESLTTTQGDINLDTLNITKGDAVSAEDINLNTANIEGKVEAVGSVAINNTTVADSVKGASVSLANGTVGGAIEAVKTDVVLNKLTAEGDVTAAEDVTVNEGEVKGTINAGANVKVTDAVVKDINAATANGVDDDVTLNGNVTAGNINAENAQVTIETKGTDDVVKAVTVGDITAGEVTLNATHAFRPNNPVSTVDDKDADSITAGAIVAKAQEDNVDTFDVNEAESGNVTVKGEGIVNAASVKADKAFAVEDKVVANVAGAVEADSASVAAEATLNAGSVAVTADASVAGILNTASVKVGGAFAVNGTVNTAGKNDLGEDVYGAIEAASINQNMQEPLVGSVTAGAVTATAGDIILNKLVAKGDVIAKEDINLNDADVTGKVEAEGAVAINKTAVTTTVKGATVSLANGTVGGAIEATDGNADLSYITAGADVTAKGNVNVLAGSVAGKVEAGKTAAVANTSVAGTVTGADVSIANATVGTVNGTDFIGSKVTATDGNVDFYGPVKAGDVEAVKAAVNVNSGKVEAGNVTAKAFDVKVNAEADVKAVTADEATVAGKLIAEGKLDVEKALTVSGTAEVTKEVEAGSASVSGKLTGASLAVDTKLDVTATGTADIKGDVTADEATVAGKLTAAGKLDVKKALSVSGTAEVTKEVEAGSATVAGTLSGASLAVDNKLYVTAAGIADIKGDVTADEAIVAGELTAAGKLDVEKALTVSGTAEVTKEIEAGSATVAGKLTGASLDVDTKLDVTAKGTAEVTGAVTANDVDVAGTLKAASVAVDNNFNVVGTAEVTGAVTVGNDTNAGSVYVSGKLKADKLTSEKGLLNVKAGGSLEASNEVAVGDADVAGTLNAKSLTAKAKLTVSGLAVVEEAIKAGTASVSGEMTGASLAVDNKLDVTATGKVGINGDVIADEAAVAGKLTAAGKLDVEKALSVADAAFVAAEGAIEAGSASVSGEMTGASLAVTTKLDVTATGKVGIKGDVTADEAAVAGKLTAEGKLDVEKALSVSGTAEVTGDVTADEATVSGTLTGASLDVEKALSVSGTAEVTGAVSANDVDVAGTGKLTAKGDLTVDNALTIAGTAAVSADAVSAKNAAVDGTLTAAGDITVTEAFDGKGTVSGADVNAGRINLNKLTADTVATTDGDMVVTDITVKGSDTVEDDVYAKGSINFVKADVIGNVKAEKDIAITAEAKITGDVVAGQDINLTAADGKKVVVSGNINAANNMTLNNSANIDLGKDVTVGDALIFDHTEMTVNGKATIGKVALNNQSMIFNGDVNVAGVAASGAKAALTVSGDVNEFTNVTVDKDTELTMNLNEKTVTTAVSGKEATVILNKGTVTGSVVANEVELNTVTIDTLDANDVTVTGKSEIVNAFKVDHDYAITGKDAAILVAELNVAEDTIATVKDLKLEGSVIGDGTLTAKGDVSVDTVAVDNANITGKFEATGNVSADVKLDINGKAQIGGDIQAGSATLTADDKITVEKNVNIEKDLTLVNSENIYLNGDVLSVGGTLSFDHTEMTVNSDKAIIGKVALNNQSMTFANAATIGKFEVEGTSSINTKAGSTLENVVLKDAADFTMNLNGNTSTVNGKIFEEDDADATLRVNNGTLKGSVAADTVVLSNVTLEGAVDATVAELDTVTAGNITVDEKLVVKNENTVTKFTGKGDYAVEGQGDGAKLTADLAIDKDATATVSDVTVVGNITGEGTLKADSVTVNDVTVGAVSTTTSFNANNVTATGEVSINGDAEISGTLTGKDVVLSATNNITVKGAVKADTLDLNNSANINLEDAVTVTKQLNFDADSIEFNGNADIAKVELDSQKMIFNKDVTFDEIIASGNSVVDVKGDNNEFKNVNVLGELTMNLNDKTANAVVTGATVNVNNGTLEGSVKADKVALDTVSAAVVSAKDLTVAGNVTIDEFSAEKDYAITGKDDAVLTTELKIADGAIATLKDFNLTGDITGANGTLNVTDVVVDGEVNAASVTADGNFKSNGVEANELNVKGLAEITEVKVGATTVSGNLKTANLEGDNLNIIGKGNAEVANVNVSQLTVETEAMLTGTEVNAENMKVIGEVIADRVIGSNATIAGTVTAKEKAGFDGDVALTGTLNAADAIAKTVYLNGDDAAVNVDGVLEAVVKGAGAADVKAGSMIGAVDAANADVNFGTVDGKNIINAKDVEITAQEKDITENITAGNDISITGKDKDNKITVSADLTAGGSVTVKDALLSGNVTADKGVDIEVVTGYTGTITITDGAVVTVTGADIDNINIVGGTYTLKDVILGSQVNDDFTASDRAFTGFATYKGDYVGNISGDADVTIEGYLFGAYVADTFVKANVEANSLTVNADAEAGDKVTKAFFAKEYYTADDPNLTAMVEVEGIVNAKYAETFTYADVTATAGVTVKNLFVGSINAGGDVVLGDYESALSEVVNVTPDDSPNGFYAITGGVIEAAATVTAGSLTANNVNGKVTYHVNNEFVAEHEQFAIRKYVVVTDGANVEAGDAAIDGTFLGKMVATGDVVMNGTIAGWKKETVGTATCTFNGVEYGIADITAGTFTDSENAQYIKANITATGADKDDRAALVVNNNVEGNLNATLGSVDAKAKVTGTVTAQINASVKDVTGTVTATAGDVNVAENGVVDGAVTAGNDVNASAATINNNVTAGNNANVNIVTGTVTAGNDVTVAENGVVDGAVTATAGSVNASAATINSAVTAGIDANVKNVTGAVTAAENVTVAEDGVVVGAVTATTGDVTVNANAAVTGDVTAGNDVNATTGTITGAVNAGNDANVADVNGTVIAGNDVNATTGIITGAVEAGNNATVNQVNASVTAIAGFVKATGTVDGSVEAGTYAEVAEVTNNVTAKDGGVTATGDVYGFINATGDVTANGIVGSYIKGANVTADMTVGGYIDATGNVEAKDAVTEYINATGDVTAANVGGYIKGANVTANGTVGEYIEATGSVEAKDAVTGYINATGDVTAESTVGGYIEGANVTAKDTVGGYIDATGNVTAESTVGGYINGADVTAKGDVAGNITATGFVNATAKVTGNVTAGTSADVQDVTGDVTAETSAVVNGTVGGDVNVNVGSATVNGTVDGDVVAGTDAVVNVVNGSVTAQNVTVGIDGAAGSVGGDITVAAGGAVNVNGTVDGQVNANAGNNNVDVTGSIGGIVFVSNNGENHLNITGDVTGGAGSVFEFDAHGENNVATVTGDINVEEFTVKVLDEIITETGYKADAAINAANINADTVTFDGIDRTVEVGEDPQPVFSDITVNANIDAIIVNFDKGHVTINGDVSAALTKDALSGYAEIVINGAFTQTADSALANTKFVVNSIAGGNTLKAGTIEVKGDATANLTATDGYKDQDGNDVVASIKVVNGGSVTGDVKAVVIEIDGNLTGNANGGAAEATMVVGGDFTGAANYFADVTVNGNVTLTGNSTVDNFTFGADDVDLALNGYTLNVANGVSFTNVTISGGGVIAGEFTVSNDLTVTGGDVTLGVTELVLGGAFSTDSTLVGVTDVTFVGNASVTGGAALNLNGSDGEDTLELSVNAGAISGVENITLTSDVTVGAITGAAVINLNGYTLTVESIDSEVAINGAGNVIVKTGDFVANDDFNGTLNVAGNAVVKGDEVTFTGDSNAAAFEFTADTVEINSSASHVITGAIKANNVVLNAEGLTLANDMIVNGNYTGNAVVADFRVKLIKENATVVANAATIFELDANVENVVIEHSVIDAQFYGNANANKFVLMGEDEELIVSRIYGLGGDDTVEIHGNVTLGRLSTVEAITGATDADTLSYGDDMYDSVSSITDVETINLKGNASVGTLSGVDTVNFADGVKYEITAEDWALEADTALVFETAGANGKVVVNGVNADALTTESYITVGTDQWMWNGTDAFVNGTSSLTYGDSDADGKKDLTWVIA